MARRRPTVQNHAGGLRMLEFLTAEHLADTREFGPVARTAVVAEAALARVAGRPGSHRDSGPRPLRTVGRVHRLVHRPAPQRWPADRTGARLG